MNNIKYTQNQKPEVFHVYALKNSIVKTSCYSKQFTNSSIRDYEKKAKTPPPKKQTNKKQLVVVRMQRKTNT